MPSAETLIQAAYVLTALTLGGLVVFVVTQLRRWARAAREEEAKR